MTVKLIQIKAKELKTWKIELSNTSVSKVAKDNKLGWSTTNHALKTGWMTEAVYAKLSEYFSKSTQPA